MALHLRSLGLEDDAILSLSHGVRGGPEHHFEEFGRVGLGRKVREGTGTDPHDK